MTNFQYGRWVAVDDDTYDGPGSPIGYGLSEQDAIKDLQQELAERDERREARLAAREHQ